MPGEGKKRGVGDCLIESDRMVMCEYAPFGFQGIKCIVCFGYIMPHQASAVVCVSIVARGHECKSGEGKNHMLLARMKHYDFLFDYLSTRLCLYVKKALESIPTKMMGYCQIKKTSVLLPYKVRPGPYAMDDMENAESVAVGFSRGGQRRMYLVSSLPKVTDKGSLQIRTR